MSSLPRSYPATFLTTLPPDLATTPSARTIVVPMTRSRTAPCSNRVGPVAAVATRPPTVPRRGGSAASHWPAEASRAWRSSSRIPACATATRSPAVCSTSPSSRVRSSTRSHRDGGAPHCSRVPAPRGTTARSLSDASRRTADTSSTEAGDATQRGRIPPTWSASEAAASDPWTASLRRPSTSVARVLIRTAPRARRSRAGGRRGACRALRRTGAVWETPCRGWRSRPGRTRSGPAASCRGRRRRTSAA